ncbi:hypothetical protein [Streptomyces sp. TS71-3]|uniref:hypothetical protein n=1 Tax=Streptomyces sp. TS71-3 TaxID=2733862 RepID=UPI001AFF245F|nr:hypothetical protein [Streptomyces sp. TS71-3]GHJ37261.1 hypothetical protein Sm713_28700 [Streptomyces sp. TS71-3]
MPSRCPTAAELARFGVETSIVVPGPFAGTDLFAKAATSADEERRAEYDTRYPGLMAHIGSRLASLAPKDADEAMVADAVVEVVGTPRGQRPFRVHVDPVNDGSEAVSEVADRARVTFLGRLGLSDLLKPQAPPRH